MKIWADLKVFKICDGTVRLRYCVCENIFNIIQKLVRGINVLISKMFFEPPSDYYDPIWSKYID